MLHPVAAWHLVASSQHPALLRNVSIVHRQEQTCLHAHNTLCSHVLMHASTSSYGPQATHQVLGVQGLRCFPLFLMRIVVGTLLAVIYAASYANQGDTFGSIAERSFIFMLVAGILPLLTFTSLPVYSNAWKVRSPFWQIVQLCCMLGEPGGLSSRAATRETACDGD